MPRLSKRCLSRLFFAVCAVLLLCAVAGVFLFPEQAAEWKTSGIEARDTFFAWVNTLNPWYLIGAFAFLPAVGAPISPFYFAAGAFDLKLMLPAMLGALLVNMTLSYWVSIGILRPLVERLLRRFGHEIPQARSDERLMLTVAIRLCGLPYLFQNWVLALGGVPFRTFITVSMLIQGLIAIAVICLGESIIHGRVAGIIFASLFVVGIMLCLKLLRHHMNKKALLREETATEEA